MYSGRLHGRSVNYSLERLNPLNNQMTEEYRLMAEKTELSKSAWN